ncbi:MAG: alpha/beta hydrolase [Actinobacteria bacterium]|nr:alpha/beta hydrolase [Actinomycetota bacterium]
MPTATVAGTPIRYLDAGHGHPAVVLLHAFPLQAAMWDDQVEALAGRWRVLAPDLAGFGSTPPPAEPRAATMGDAATTVAGLLDHLGLGPVVVGGLSMGGYVAFALLRSRPELVAGLVLADTRAGADTPEVAERRTAQEAQVAERGTAELVEPMLASLLSDETRAERPEVVDRARSLMAANPPAGVIAALEAMKGRPDATAELATIGVPTLVVVGEHDEPSPPAEAEAMAAAIPGARLEVIPGAGHLSNLERPEVFTAALETFLARL